MIIHNNYYNSNDSDEDNDINKYKKEEKEKTNKYKYTIYLAYDLLFKLIKINYEFLEYIIEKKIISILIGKIGLENEEIRKTIYEMLKFIIKQTNQYNSDLFELEEIEQEKPNINCPINELKEFIEEDKTIQAIMINEDFELYKIILLLSLYDDIELTRNYYFLIFTQLYEDYIKEKKEDKINNFLDIILSLVTLNDTQVLKRLQYILGYPSPIIKQIPKDNKTDQKWPLFGEKLINGNIDTQIYEFLNINHRINELCLLRLLLPKENDENINFVLPDDLIKKCILQILENCLGDKNNYSLFKYLYLNSARSLRYENLYYEMKNIISDDKDIKLDIYNEKEKKYIEQVNIDVENCLKDMKEEGTEIIDEDNYDPPPLGDFRCYDEYMKKFIGYNSNIIPGEVIREEIAQIATGSTLSMFRIEYFTKYYDTKELREKLLNDEKNKNEIKKEENKEINNIENKDKKKEEEKNSIQQEGDKKEENKEINKDENIVNNKEEKDKKEKEEEDKDVKQEKEEKDDNKKDKEEDDKKENDNNKEIKDEKQKEEEKKEIEEEKEEENKKEKQKEEERKETIPIETEIDDSFIKSASSGKVVKEYDIEETTENDFIYQILKSKNSLNIIENKSMQDKNKVKSVLFRYIFTNISDDIKKYRAKITTTDLTPIKRSNCCPIQRFIFDKVEETNITNFHNIYRIRGELPFISRNNNSVSIDITNKYSFEIN